MQVDSSWQEVVPGIDYQEFTLPHPNWAFVSRLDRREPSVTLDTTIAKGIFGQGTETVSGMVERYDQSVSNWGGQWGIRNNIVVAVNGSFHDPGSGMPETGMVQSGWYAKRFDDLGGSSGFCVDVGSERLRRGLRLPPLRTAAVHPAGFWDHPVHRCPELPGTRFRADPVYPAAWRGNSAQRSRASSC